MTVGDITRDGVGGQTIKRKRDGGIVDLGDEYKGAVSDALKKAAQSFGVGLYLARGHSSPAQAGQQIRQQGDTRITEPSNLASDKQLNMIRAVCKSIGRTVPAGIQGWTKREASQYIDTIKSNPPAPEQEPEEAF
jgi:hypothetical protein